jgi:hypothetical protein
MLHQKFPLANLPLYFIITVGVNTSTMSFCFTSRQYYYSSPSLSSKLSSSSLSSIARSSFAKLRRQTVSTTSTTTTTTTTTFSNTQNQSTTSTFINRSLSSWHSMGLHSNWRRKPSVLCYRSCIRIRGGTEGSETRNEISCDN